MAPRWFAIAAGVAVVSLGLDRLGIPSPVLLAALVVGLLAALAPVGSPRVPSGVFKASQAVAGVVLGAYLQTDALEALAGSWIPVVLVSVATLLLSLVAGLLVARSPHLDAPTASLGTIAGGASGIVGMSGELGADDRIVAFMQYLRVLIVVLVTPLGIALFFGGSAGSGGPPGAETFGSVLDWVLTAGLAVLGALAASSLRITAGVLLGPLVLTGVLILAGPLGGFEVPAVLSQAAFALIGLQVGLGFTPGLMRRLRHLVVPTLAMIAFLILACFGLAVALAATTHASLVDSYLATTPGGLYAVVGLAYGTGSDTTFIVGVQALRVIAMVLLAPLAVRWTLDLLRRHRPAAPPDTQPREPSPSP